jgi:hypothetical protein
MPPLGALTRTFNGNPGNRRGNRAGLSRSGSSKLLQEEGKVDLAAKNAVIFISQIAN